MRLFCCPRGTRLRRTRWTVKSNRPLVAIALIILALVAGPSAQSKDGKRARARIDQGQRQEIKDLVDMIDAAMTGGSAPSDVPMTWQQHFLKGRERTTTYVPFTVVIEPSTLKAPSVAFCVRVVPRGVAPRMSELTSDAGKGDSGERANSQMRYTFEEVYFLDLKPSYAGAPPSPVAATPAPSGTRPIGQRPAGRAVYRISRAFAAPPGDYDVYFAIREQTTGVSAASGQMPAAVRASVAKESLTVPNYWTDELAASSIILIDRMDSLSTPIPPEQQTERPYALGNTEILPLLEAKLWKSQELSAVFFVYNPALDADRKPNVTVEYGFQRLDKSGPLRKTAPLVFSAQTLPPQFDPAAGYQIGAGQSVPLSSFTEGDYKLDVTVTDKNSGKSLTLDVNFTIVPSIGS